MSTNPSRYWCITWNNPPAELIANFELVSEIFESCEFISYATWQVEKGASGTDHFQMYIESKKPVRMSALKKILHKSIHCEVRKGSRAQARDYCRKEDSRLLGPFEYGTWEAETQGRRSDLETIVNCAKEGKSLRETYDVVGASVFRNAKYFDRARLTFGLDKPRVKPVVVVHWGESGAGKTHDAVGSLEPSDYFIKAPGKWWDGYEGQDVVIIDDVQPCVGAAGVEVYHNMLRMLDKYQFQVEIKGNVVPFVSSKIFLTSNHHPRSWFPDVADKKPLFRRIQSCIHYTGDFEEDTVVRTETNLTEELNPIF